MPGGIDGTFLGLTAYNEIESSVSSKIAHDRYEVYVNDDFVGHKTLLNQSEDIIDVNDFLQTQGLSQFSASLKGDRYKINAEGENVKKIADALGIYLQNR